MDESNKDVSPEEYFSTLLNELQSMLSPTELLNNMGVTDPDDLLELKLDKLDVEVIYLSTAYAKVTDHPHAGRLLRKIEDALIAQEKIEGKRSPTGRFAGESGYRPVKDLIEDIINFKGV